jgi:hypothetical protein
MPKLKSEKGSSRRALRSTTVSDSDAAAGPAVVEASDSVIGAAELTASVPALVEMDADGNAVVPEYPALSAKDLAVRTRGHASPSFICPRISP